MGFVKNESFGGEPLGRTTKLLAGISGRVGKAVQSAMPRVICISAGKAASGYSNDTAPYFAGEMISTRKLPTVKREILCPKEIPCQKHHAWRRIFR